MKPILFSTPMVRAILAGQKTMTRRAIDKDVSNKFDVEIDGKPIVFIDQATGDRYKPESQARYHVGDILWVRETWRINAWSELDQKIQVDFKADGSSGPRWIFIDNEELFDRLWTQSTEDAENAGYRYNQFGHYEWEDGAGPCRWRPSIFMPKAAARMYNYVVEVRAERLLDITEDDARREGFQSRDEFLRYWDKLNTKRGYGTSVNPWVWAYTFERITREEAQA